MTRVTLRLQRNGVLAMGALGIFYGAIQAGAYISAAGATAASRAAFGHQMAALGTSLTYLLPVPVRVDTMSGYLQWRVYGALPLLFGFWALMSAAGAARGDEDRGLVDQWLSAGIAPVRYLAFRFAGFAVAAVAAVAATSAAISVGAAGAGSPLDAAAVTELSVALVGVTLACYSIELVLAQLTGSRNAAAGLGGALLLVLFFINSFGRSVAALSPVAAAISPFHYFDRSNPLTPGGAFDAGATAGLVIAALALTALAAGLMSRRDLGSPLLQRRARLGRPERTPSTNALLRQPVLATLFEHRAGLLAWGLGSAAGAAYIASIGRQLVDLVKAPGSFRAYLTLAGHGDPYVAITGFFWFAILEMLIAVYAITLVARWAAEDSEGRLETVLSAPISRTRVVLERAAALALGSGLIVAFSSAIFYVTERGAGIELQAGDLAAASLPLVPFALTFAAVGAVVAGRAPRLAVAVLAVVALLSYLLTEAGPLMKLPDWVVKLSVFSLYGAPLSNGVYWTGLWAMAAVTVVGFGLATVLMGRRDVGS